MRAIGAMAIVSFFVVVWVVYAVIWTGYQAKRVSSKQGRAEIAKEVSDATTFIVKDKDFHKEINKEFRGLYIVLGLVVLALIGTALGLG